VGLDIDVRIGAVARKQRGLVTTAQLLEVGLSRGAVKRRARRGLLRRLHRGVYLVGPTTPPWAEELAALLACRADVLLSHRSATSLWGLTTHEGGPVEITAVGRQPRPRPGLRIHRTTRLDADERREVHGIPVTSPGRTLLDLACVASPRVVEQALARAEREHLVDRAELREIPSRYRGRKGVPLLRSVLSASEGPVLTRSEAEARLLALVREAQLPTPEVNVRLQGYEVDFLWRMAGIAVEVDGYRHHSSLPSFEGDRRRATHLAALGIQVVPLTWRQIVEDGVATAVLLGKTLLWAELRRGAGR
jgi:very-short-patch-repair endonuclease